MIAPPNLSRNMASSEKCVAFCGNAFFSRQLMKVITKGKGWRLNITCKGCEAVLEIETEDLNYELSTEDATNQQYELEIEGRYFVECVECTTRIDIKSKNIPTKIREKARCY